MMAGYRLMRSTVVDPAQTFEILDNGQQNRPFSVTVWNSRVQTAGSNLIASG